MDPIHPITPGPSPIARGSVPVERLQRISRERDRRNKDPLARDRKPQPGYSGTGAEPPEEPPEEDGSSHIDVRA
jgi:hypothetical protein